MRTLKSNRLMPGASLAAMAALMVLQPQLARAQGYSGTGTVTLGSATINNAGNTTTVSIAANSPSTTINWLPSDTATGSTPVNFLQSGKIAEYNVANGTVTAGSYTVLNRIIPTDSTRSVALNGTVNSTSNVNVWFYTPGGLLIGSTARFNVGGLLLSTSEVVGRSDGNLVSDSGQFSVAGTEGSQSAVTIANGAELRAESMNQSSYIVAIAPKIEQNGLISVRGSAALVAAESASFAIDNNGLFNISVAQGTSVTGAAFSHMGTTGGPSEATPLPAGDFRRVYMVAVPKNQAITMMVQSGGALGFDVAAGARVDGNTVVLSAGNNIVDKGVGDPTAARPVGSSGPVDLTIGSRDFKNSNLFVNGTGNVTISGALTNAGPKLSLSSANDVIVNAAISNGSDKASLVLRADNDGGDGTVTFSGGSASFGGAGSTAELYYNPGTFGTPTSFSGNVTAGTLTAYQLVNNVTNLQAIGGFLSQDFALGRDIDAASIATPNGDPGFNPIGAGTAGFQGKFDGQNYVISGLFINRAGTDDVGLFSRLDTGSRVSRVGLTGVQITGRNGVGALAGSNFGSVDQSYSTGTVNGGGQRTGGLLGSNGSAVNNSYSAAEVSGLTSVGGLVGTHSNGNITASYATGNVSTAFSGDAKVGGLIGENTAGITIGSYATGSVGGSADSDSLGGLIGSGRNAIVTGSYATGIVSGGNSIGGLIGDSSSGNVIERSYATGAVSGGNNVGGFVGNNNNSTTITQAYSVGVVTGTTNVGRFAGNNAGTVTSAYFNTSVAGPTNGVGTGSATGITGLTTTQMQDVNNFRTNFEGFDFDTVWAPPSTGFYPELYATSNVVSVTPDNATRIYGDQNATFTATYRGLRADDTIVNFATLSSTATAATGVGTYAITATGVTVSAPVVGSAYRIVYVPGTLTINQRRLDVTYTAQAASRVYGNANPSFTGATVASNLVNGDTQAQVLTGTAVFTSLADRLSNVGTYAVNGSGVVTASGTPGSNYFLNEIQAPSNSTALQITQRTLIVNANAKSRVYGNANPTLTFSSSGLIAEDSFTGGLVTEATAASDVGSYEITQGTLSVARGGTTNSVLGNYNLLYLSNFLDITPRALTVTYAAGPQPQSRQYGDNNLPLTGVLNVPDAASATATTGLATLNGVTDTRAQVLTGAEIFTSTATASSNVGSYAITGSGVSVLSPAAVGSRSGNYTVTFEQAPTNATALTITRRLIDVSADAKTRIYGDANPTLTFTTSDLGAGAPVQGLLATTATQTSGVGAVAITVGSVTDANNPNYMIAFNPANLTITARPIDVTYIANATSRTYGDTNPTFNGSFIVSNLANGDAQAAVVTGPAVFTSTAGRLDNVGQYVITGSGVVTSSGSGALGLNYTFRSSIQADGNATALAIAPRPLVVQANPQSRVYGNTNPSLNVITSGVVTSSGLIMEDSLAGVLATGAGPTSNVGRFAITQGLLDVERTGAMTSVLSNYSLTFINSFLDITPRALTITYAAAPTPNVREYGDANPPLTGSATAPLAASPTATTGLVNADTVETVTAGSTAVFDTNATVFSGIGNYAITGSGLVGSSANYTYTFLQAAGNANALTITPRQITVTPNAQTRLYGDTNPLLTFNVARTSLSGPGLVNNDSLTGSLFTPATATSNVGQYDILQGSLAASPNYTLNVVSGTNLFSITSRPIDLTYVADRSSRIYGETNPAFSGTFSVANLANGDAQSAVVTGPAVFTSTADRLVNVGFYAITGAGVVLNTGAGGLGGNYVIGSVIQVPANATALEITRRSLTVQANPQSRIYGNANPSLNVATSGVVSTSGLIAEDSLTGMLAANANLTSNVGRFAITQNTLGVSRSSSMTSVLNNYSLTFINSFLDITPRALTVIYDANSAVREYGDTNPPLDGIVRAAATDANTGLVNGDTVDGGMRSVTTGAALFTTTADRFSDVGSYAITGSGVSGNSANYTFSFVQDAGNATTGSDLSANSANFTFSVVQDLGNATSLTINQRRITVTADPKSRTYGDANPPLTFAVTRTSPLSGAGLVNNDAFTGGLVTVANASSSVGDFAIMQGNLAASANYDLDYVGANLTINQRPLVLTYTATPATRVYGDNNPPLTGTVTGNNFVNGDAVASAADGTASFVTNALGTSNVGNYFINGVGLSAKTTNNNYAVSFAQAASNATAFTITPRALQITYAATASTRIYGDANPAFTGTLSANGLQHSDTVASVTMGSSAVFTTPATVRSDVGNYAINGSGLVGSSANYTYSFVQAAGNATALSITPRLLTVTYNADPKARLYGDANPAQTGFLTAVGLVNEQALVSEISGFASFATSADVTSNVGTYAIVGSGVSGLSSNYTYVFQQAAGNATALSVTPRPLVLTYTADAKTRTYDDVNPPLTGAVAGNNFVNGNSVATVTSGTAVFTTIADPASNAGSYAINGGGLTANTANYAVSFAQAASNATALSITPHALQITYAATASTRIYGDANPAFTGTLSAIGLRIGDTIASVTVGSSAIFGTPATVRSDVGNYAINGSGLVGSSPNYAYSFVQSAGNATALSITPRLLTITYNADPKARFYGDANPTLTGSLTAVGLVNEQALVSEISGSATFASSADVTSNVGTYTIVGSGVSGLSSNYTYVFQQAAGNATALSVTPRPLLITYTADTKSRIYGDVNPPLTGTATAAGLVNGNTLGMVTSGNTAFATLADERSNAGSHAITGSGLSATNSNYAYTFQQAVTNNNALLVTRRTVVVNAEPSTRVYGDENPAFTFRSGGLVNGDTFTGALATPADVRSNIGTYDILQGTLALSANYNIDYIKSTIDITPRALTLTADAQTRIYGNANPALNFVIGGRGLANGDTLTGGLTTVADARSNVGSYLIAQGSLAATSNYTVTYVSNQLAVTPRALTLTANAQTRIYGNTNPDLTFVIGGLGLVNGDVLTGGLSTPADLRSNVGSYAINQGTLAATTNYAVTYVGNLIQVTPRAITVAADAQTRVYGDANPALTFRVGGLGLVNGDTLSGGQVTTADVRSNVGTYGINRGTLNATPNYTVTYIGSNLVVTPRPLLVTGDDQSRIFGDANPPFTFTVGASGLVNGDTLTGSLTTPAGTGTPAGNYAIQQGTLAATPNYALTYRDGRLTVIPCTSGPGCVTQETVADISSEISSTVQDSDSDKSDESESEGGGGSPKINISATINTQNVSQIPLVTEPITGTGNVTLWATVDVEDDTGDLVAPDIDGSQGGASDGAGNPDGATDSGDGSGNSTGEDEEKKKGKGKKPTLRSAGGTK